ncbi:MAG: bifunctional phosphoribosyl-AMP cyclohydrolase/phosphoribosyl-ATP diphosphatase HisIE [Candidatus Aenigmarchaeota archaeon]|nr:bifunctional phosphoribosyl-AMP cyclohydrolase/phosphoribosyl-ATP diphosphatase HisIE [Candidatus Aenigmarchaeota archaeon]
MIIPSIDLIDGKAVQLVGGKKKILEREDVLELARRFGVYGDVAVIDLDAAMNKCKDNTELIKKICKITKCNVGGGIRTKQKAEELLKSGAKKIIIGTKANRDFLMQLPKDRLIVAIDSKEGFVVNEGWKNKTNKTPQETVAELKDYCCGFLYTLIESEGRMQGIDLEKIKQIRKMTKNRLIAAGGISSLEQIKELDKIDVDCQIGMALYTGKLDLTECFAGLLDFNKTNGLIPTIVQDEANQVLMLAYSSRESLKQALKKQKGIYYSRSRKQLWRKGETSGNTQQLLNVKYDCDKDTLLFRVRQSGVACHKGSYSCFGAENREFNLKELYGCIKDRVNKPRKGSYTSLVSRDEKSIKEKIKEESGEVLNYTDKDNLIWEIADLTYFILVLMAKKNIAIEDVINELEGRRK